jgi:hypothetical protein
MIRKSLFATALWFPTTWFCFSAPATLVRERKSLVPSLESSHVKHFFKMSPDAHVRLLALFIPDVSRPVLVGDYSEANPDSVQLRNFVVGEGGGPVALSSPNETLRLARIEPVTTAGFVAARLPADPFSPIPDQYLSVVGYGSNSSWETIYRDYYYFDHERTYPGKATEATVQVIDFHHCVEVLYNPLLNETTTFCALAPGASESSGAGPCAGTCCDWFFSFSCLRNPCSPFLIDVGAGDHGAPVLDGTGSLVGLARNTCKYDRSTVFFRSSPV